MPRARLRLLLVLVLPWLGACVTTSGGSGGGFFSNGQTASGELWELPADAFPTQRLYRVKYRGPEGKASFKLTLYLASEARYRLQAADSLGRKLWSLEVDENGEAVWLNHRSKEFCRAQGASRLVVVPLANLPLLAMPKLLLGRIPSKPVANLQRGDRHVSYLDARGQKWTGVAESGELDWWSLEDSGETVAWWRRDEVGGNFSDPEGRQGASWKEIIREPLTGPIGRLEIPGKFREGTCGEDSDTG